MAKAVKSPEEKVEANVATVISDVLRNRPRLFETIQKDRFLLATLQLLLFAAIFLAIYGFVMVSHINTEHALRVALKFPIIFGASILLTMPTLYVFSAMRGSELNLRQMFSSVLAGTALTSVILFALIPIVWLFAFSNASVGFLKFLNFLFVFGAILGGLLTVNGAFCHISKEKRVIYKGAGILVLWALLFLLVFAQMTANFGPFFEKTDEFIRSERKGFVEVFFMPKDSDEDGLSDVRERMYGTDPEKKDTDGDGKSDKWEVDNYYDPLEADKDFSD